MPTDAETDNLLRTLADRRAFLVGSAEGLTDEQARSTPTVSTLSVGGIVKHVTATERSWIAFVKEGAPDDDVDYFIDWSAVDWSDPASVPAWGPTLPRPNQKRTRASQRTSSGDISSSEECRPLC